MLSFGLTDVGCVRKQNQDTYKIVHLAANAQLCVVCDGMGGAKSGNVASTLAVDVFTQEVCRSWKPNMSWDSTEKVLKSAVRLANFTVFDQACQFPEFDGMGTTLVAALIWGNHMVVVNVGDSRAYRINSNGIFQITKDHSIVQMMVDRGELTKEVARTYPGKNLITRAIGTENLIMADLFRFDVRPGDAVLLCSDGLSNMMDDEEILFEIAYGLDRTDCCQRLLDIAKMRGSPDNVTCVLIFI